MPTVKQANREDRAQVAKLITNQKGTITLHNGKTVKVGYIIPETQDKIDSLIVEYEEKKQSLQPINPEEVEKGKEPKYNLKDLNRLNKITRQFYAQCAAAILLNHYWGIKLLWWLKWRCLYRSGKFNGEDYLNITIEAKKKAQEQEYSMAMVLLMDMTTTWTMMTKKEAEEYHHELELEREAQSLRNSQH